MVQSRGSEKRQIIELFIISVLLWFSLFVYLPTLPLFLKGKIDSLATVGLILSMYGFAQLTVRIPAGIFSDRTGRRKAILIFCFIAMGIGPLMLLYGNSVPVLMVARTLTGIGAAAWVILVTLFTSLFPRSRVVAASALITIANGVGKSLSTLLTGFINEAGGPEAVFYISSGSSAVALIILLTMHIPREKPWTMSFSDTLSVFGRREVVVATIGHGIAMIALWAVILSFLPVQARELGAGDIDISIIFSLHLAAFTLSNYLNSRLSSRVSVRQRVFAAAICFSLGNLGTAWGASIGILAASGIISGLGFGFLQSSFIGYSISKVEQNRRSSALGFHQSLYSAGIFIGPWIGGVLADAVGIGTMSLIIASVCFVVLLFTASRVDI